MANTKQYSDLAAAINKSLVTANITTLTFTAKVDEVVNTVTYSNILDFEGYHLQSSADSVEKILDEAFAKIGAFSVVKSPSRLVSPPADPADDHYQVTYGFYLDNKDLPPGEAEENKLNADVQKIAQSNSSSIKSTTRALKYTTKSDSSIFNITDPDGIGDRTITINTTVVINKPV